jgi:chromosome segregation ATPase
MVFFEKHGVKLQVATIAAVLIFIIGTTITATQDRGAMIDRIEVNKREMRYLKDEIEISKMERSELRKELKEEVSALKEENQATEISYTEIKTKLVGLEAMLLKIDGKIN